MYAVVRTGGKQYRVEEGRAVKVDRLPGEPGDTVELGDVLLMGEGEAITIGAPTVEGARVLGTIAEQGRDAKIVVFRYKSKTRSRKKTGHRQHFTKIVVDDILAAGQQAKPKPVATAPEEEPAAEAPKKRGRRKAVAEQNIEVEERVAGLADPSAEAAETPDAESAEAAPEAAADEAPAENVEAPAEKPKRPRKKTTE
ncbi:MAG: 50S ribosomal protein L21 [Dehalococcoidia bacterium]